MEGSLNKRLREREETPPPAKKRCTQATPPAPASSKNNGSSNGHDATHTELESLGRNGSARRSSRTSATSSTTSSPPASPARRGRRGAAGGSSSSEQQPQTPTRSSGRLRQSYHLSFETVLLVICHQSLPTRSQTFVNVSNSWRKATVLHQILIGSDLWLTNRMILPSGILMIYRFVHEAKIVFVQEKLRKLPPCSLAVILPAFSTSTFAPERI